MRRKLHLIFCLTLIITCFGCASLQLGEDATATEKKAAACLDAQTGLSMADAALATVPQVGASEYVLYWQAFRAGALIGINSYCVTPVVSTTVN